MEQHSKTFGFSSAHRWVYCTGAPKLCHDIPDVPSQEAEEGTAAHWVSYQMLQAYKAGADGLPIGLMLVGMKAPNGIIVTDEIYDGAIVYYKAVIAVVGDDRENLHLEIRVDARMTLDPEAWGSADAIYYCIKTNTLYVWDFKFGFRPVKAFDNLQLAGYAIAAIESFKLTKINPRLKLVIVQPRRYDGEGQVQTWTTVTSDLRAHENMMKGAIIQYRMNKSELKAGEWCRDCRGAHLCPSLLAATAGIIDGSTDPVPHSPTNEAVAFELEKLERAEALIKQRKTAIETEAEARLRKGEVIPGLVMKDVTGHRAWTVGLKELDMLSELYHISFRKEPEPVSPAQAEKILARKGVDASVIEPYYHKLKTGVKLAKDDGSKARQIFSQEKLCQPKHNI